MSYSRKLKDEKKKKELRTISFSTPKYQINVHVTYLPNLTQLQLTLLSSLTRILILSLLDFIGILEVIEAIYEAI